MLGKFFSMEGFEMIEGTSTSQEITNFNQIDQSILKEFIENSTVWNFYEMTKEQYTNRDEGEKKSLILQYCNKMVQGNNLLFVVWSFCLEFVV